METASIKNIRLGQLLKEAGYVEHTNSWANLWSDEQKSHQAIAKDKVAIQTMQKCSTTLRLLKRAVSSQTIGRTISWI